MNAVYEPWHPREGQRVRVRLNPECQMESHCPESDRLTGTVSEILPDEDLDEIMAELEANRPGGYDREQVRIGLRHPYVVDYDQGYGTYDDPRLAALLGPLHSGGEFAAAELIALED